MRPDWMEQAIALVERAESRRQQKRLGAWLEDQPIELRAAVTELARRRGVDLPDDAAGWPGKRLLRLARGREAGARVRSNPVRVDEAFQCSSCGHEAELGGARVRDHCPACLHGLHVDVVPGDRAADCGGVLVPESLELVAGEAVIRYRCTLCGARPRVRAHPDDRPAALSELSATGR